MQLSPGRRGLAAVALAAAACVAAAAQPSVPYVPTPQDVVERMLQIAKVGAGDYLIDLGSGDGRIVITAARKHGIRGFGVDLDPDRIRESNQNARRAGVADKAAFYQRDLFQTDLTAATVVTMYLLPRVNMQLRPTLLGLKPGTRIVSHDFSLEDWQPDQQARMDVPGKWGDSGGTSDIYLWVVPAQVAGEWRWELNVGGRPVGYRVTLRQKFQVVTGQANMDGRRVALQNVRLAGDEFAFSFSAEVNGAALRHEFSGKVAGDGIAGVAAVSGGRVQGRYEWNARRTGPAAPRAGADTPRALPVSARVPG